MPPARAQVPQRPLALVSRGQTGCNFAFRPSGMCLTSVRIGMRCLGFIFSFDKGEHGIERVMCSVWLVDHPRSACISLSNLILWLLYGSTFFAGSPADAAVAKAWRGREPFQLAQVLRADLDASSLYTASMYALYKRGDAMFETLLHSGSLLSLWHRLHAICKRQAVLGQEVIKWSVVRQAPRLNR